MNIRNIFLISTCVRSQLLGFLCKLQSKVIFVAISRASKKELTSAACRPESEQEMMKCDCDLPYFEEAGSFVREYLSAGAFSVYLNKVAHIQLPQPEGGFFFAETGS